ncbi:internalin, putative, partial [hydrothermal vent metagenome]
DDYALIDSETVTTENLLSIVKTISATDQASSAGTDVVIGEVVTYELTVTVIEGTTNTVNITDTLPQELTFIAGTLAVTPNGPGMTTSYVDEATSATWTPATRVLTVDLGTVTNPGDNNAVNDTVTITFDVLVANDTNNNNNETKTNTVAVTDGVRNDSDTIDVTVREPELTITTSVSDATPHLNDVIQYTLTVDHSAGSTEDAFDLTLTDLLPSTDLSIISIDSIGGTNADSFAVGDFTITGGGSGIAFTAPGTLDLALTNDFTITYSVQVTNDIADYGSSYTNNAHLSWTSTDGPNSDERTSGGGINDYDATDASGVTLIGADLLITKDDGAASIIPGNSNTYTITVTNKAGANADTATGIVVTDTVPTGLTMNLAATSANPFFTSFIGGVVTWTIPTLNVGASENLQLVVDVDNPAIAGLESITNTASAVHDDIDPTPADNTDSDVNILDAVPNLTITKDDGLASVAPGDNLTYTIVVQNTGNQNSSNVVVSDTFPHTVLENLVANMGGVIDSIAGTIQWNLGTLNAGDTVTLTVDAQVRPVLLAGVTGFTNTVTVADDGAGTGGIPVTDTNDDTDALQAAPDYVITKTDNQTTARPGDTITYVISVSNEGNRNGTGVIVTDKYSSALLEGVSADNGGTVDTANGTVTWNLGNLNGGDTVTLTITGTIPMIPPVGENLLVNSVEVDDDGLNGADPTPDNNLDTDKTELATFVFDSIRNDAEEDDDNKLSLIRFLEEREYTLPTMPVAPIFSGTTEPGTTITITMFDEAGSILGTQTVIGDTGGNWLTSFPNVVIYDHPYSIQMTQSISSANDSTATGFNLRTYFSPALNHQIFFSHHPSIEAVFGNSPSVMTHSLHEGLNNPLMMGWDNTYAYEFLAASATTTQYAK